jgi:S-phase kinase-associated protein 1
MATVCLESSDGHQVTVPKIVAEMSLAIKHMLEDIGDTADSPLPLPNVTGKILDRVLQFCTYHTDNPSNGSTLPKALDPPGPDGLPVKENITPWDRDYCNVDTALLFELIMAANYLDIKPLLDLTCATVAGMIKGKKAEEIRQLFNIKNDFTPEEEEAVRKESEWCEER